MAQVNDRKSKLYSQKQSVREELSAPQYLESAGDELIKRLAKKQTNTSTSLQEQLEIVQNFEKGFELNPDNRKGVTSLEDFKNHIFDEKEISTSSSEKEDIRNVNELMKITGLTRHELELGLCEKPSSKISRLYMFALQNKKQKKKPEEPEKMLLGHPINRLKEIEKEYFGHITSRKRELNATSAGENQCDKVERKTLKKKKQRKRRKKTQESPAERNPKKLPSTSERIKNAGKYKEEEKLKPPCRLSLWDVKDMKKWSEPKKIGCKPQAFYTIKNGKIIKLQAECSDGDGGKTT